MQSVCLFKVHKSIKHVLVGDYYKFLTTYYINIDNHLNHHQTLPTCLRKIEYKNRIYIFYLSLSNLIRRLGLNETFPSSLMAQK